MDTNLVPQQFFKYVSFTTAQTFSQIGISGNAVTFFLRRREVLYCLLWFLFRVEHVSYLFGNSIFPSTEHHLVTHHFKRFGRIIRLLCVRRLKEGTIKILCISKVFDLPQKRVKKCLLSALFSDLFLNVKITENNLCYFKMAVVLNN